MADNLRELVRNEPQWHRVAQLGLAHARTQKGNSILDQQPASYEVLVVERAAQG